MKASDIKEMTGAEINSALEDLNKERHNLRAQAKTGQLRDTARLNRIRKDIARVKTELTRRGRQTLAAVKE